MLPTPDPPRLSSPRHTAPAARHPRLRNAVAGGFVLAGLLHFVAFDFYAAQVPAAAGHAGFWVVLTGVCEIAGGLGLWWRPARRAAAAGLTLLLLGFLWVHVGHLFDPPVFAGRTVPGGVLVTRVPLQFVLIWLVRRAAAEYPPAGSSV